MAKFGGSRILAAICTVLAVLLAALAIVQFRWSTRVAAADVQREKEHLDSAASLFAADFNRIPAQAMSFLQNEALTALASGKPLTGVPKLIGELYFLDGPRAVAPSVRRLNAAGLFETASIPSWIAIEHCATVAIERPSALVVPIFDIQSSTTLSEAGTRVLKTLSRQADRCFVARFDETYLRDTLFPTLVRQSFGESVVREYDFSVVSRTQPQQPIYGAAVRADVEKPFFSLSPESVRLAGLPDNGPRQKSVMVLRHFETAIVVNGNSRAPVADLLGSGIWDLRITRKNMPLAVAFERTRRLDFLLGVAVEALLLAAIVFIVVSARKMSQLADQKMRFIAGVSHELRTPVSAIAMLSRNQADGLVAGAEKVKQYGELINQQSRRLNEMVEQTLQYAGIHSGLRRPVANQIDLGKLIVDSVDANRDELTRAGIEIEVALDPALPKVAGDPSLLRTAFENLLSNAQKHGRSGRWIRVDAAYSSAEKEIRISVADRGDGIDAADQSEIFEPFCRGRAAVEAQIPGSGLGLSLVRTAVEAHHGTVTMVSQPGQGSTFTMHLPV